MKTRQDLWKMGFRGRQALVLCLLTFACGCYNFPDQAPSMVNARPDSSPVPRTPDQSIAVHQPTLPVLASPAANITLVRLGQPMIMDGPLDGAVQVAAAALTLDQAIGLTLAADPRLHAGLEGITLANADLLTSSLLPNPNLVINGDFIPLQRFTPAQPGGPPELDVQVGFPVDWFLFGKRAAAMASAGLGVRQSEADFADLVRQRVTAAALAYYDLVEAKELLVLARKDTDSLAKLAAAIKKGVDAGGRTQVDLNRARLDLLASQLALNEAEAAVVVAKSKLRALMGRSDADPSFDVSGNLDAPLTVEPMPVERALAIAQENRPDLQSLRWQLNKAQADVVVETRKAYPQITPSIGYSRQYQQSLGEPDADSGYVSVTATLPFFDRNQGNRWKAKSVVAQNNFNLQAGLVDLRSEIEQVDQELRTAYVKAGEIAKDQLKLATEVRDAITKAYAEGGRPLIEVLDAQRNYHETYRLFINSRADYWRAVYKFSSAIGKQER